MANAPPASRTLSNRILATSRERSRVGKLWERYVGGLSLVTPTGLASPDNDSARVIGK